MIKFSLIWNFYILFQIYFMMLISKILLKNNWNQSVEYLGLNEL